MWRPAADGRGLEGSNHVAAHRPRRQERTPELLETGAFYVFDAAGYRAARHRFFGVVGAQLVAESRAIEIDTEEQLRLAVARVMTEGSVYDEELAALAIKQAAGDLVEAIFLLRAYRTTLPRFGYTQPLDSEAMTVERRRCFVRSHHVGLRMISAR